MRRPGAASYSHLWEGHARALGGRLCARRPPRL